MGSIRNRKADTGSADQKERTSLNIPMPLLLMYFALGMIGLLFAGLIFAYTYSAFQKDLPLLQIPSIFHANTVIILSSSILLKVGSIFLEKEEYREYGFSLLATFTLGLVFILFQVIGWAEMIQSGVSMKGSASGAYLYLISGLHLLHILGGCIPLFYMSYQAFKVRNDVVQELIFSTDPSRFSRFQLLSIYWHFIGILWLAIYVFFVFLNISAN